MRDHAKVLGTAVVPRLSVFRSNNPIMEGQIEKFARFEILFLERCEDIFNLLF